MWNKILNYFILLAGLAVIAASVHMYRTDPLSGSVFRGESLNFKILLYNDAAADVLYLTYDAKNNVIKVLSFYPSIVVLERAGRSTSLNAAFFANPDISLEEKSSAMFEKVQRLCGGTFKQDYTFIVNLNDFSASPVIEAYNKADHRYMHCAAQISLIEFLSDAARNNLIGFTHGVFNNYGFLNTDMPKLSMFNLIMHINKSDAIKDIVFIEYPWQRGLRRRVEPLDEKSAQAAKEMFADISINPLSSGRPPVLDVLNASGKRRMAERASWLLRENGFDVFDWANARYIFDTSVIKNYKADFFQCVKIQNILGCGVVINFPNSQSRRDVEVFVGKDCEITDNLDTISR